LEVTTLIKLYLDTSSSPGEKIAAIINLLALDFCKSRNVNHRKGGLIGMAAISITFVNSNAVGVSEAPEHVIEAYLQLLVPPVLLCFDDQESRVVYYACEALYNIAKVARSSILIYFNQIFDGLCKLFAHVDVDVKNGAHVLDRLIKDIVTETESFDVNVFMPLIQKHIKRTKPYIRQLLVGWISVLNSVPDISMLDYLPEFLEGLFSMLSDGNREIRQAADNSLDEFLKELSTADVTEFGPMATIIFSQCYSKEDLTRLRGLQWLLCFIRLGRERLCNVYSHIFGSIMHCVSENVVKDIASVANDANDAFICLVQETTETFDLQKMLYMLTVELLSDHEVTRVIALRWVRMLHEKEPVYINKNILHVLPVLLNLLSDDCEDVLLNNLHVIGRLSIDDSQFKRVILALNQVFVEDRRLLEVRGAFIIRQLCGLLDCKKVYIAFATILHDRLDIDYICLVVQILNLVLLTAAELSPLRNLLSTCLTSSTENQEVFTLLFKTWCHNPAAVYSLCLLAHAYDLSASLIRELDHTDVSVGFIMQGEKLILLLESPSFLPLRLQLMDSQLKHHRDLLKSLHSLLLLLPQSAACKLLSNRLGLVSALQMHKSFGGRFGKYREQLMETETDSVGNHNGRDLIYTELFTRFSFVLALHKPGFHRLPDVSADENLRHLHSDSNPTDQLRMIG